jgi:serine/threonine protein kinase
MSFEDPSVIDEYVNAQGDHLMPRKPVSDRSIYLSHNNFGALKSYWMLPKIADFGLAHRGDGEKSFRHPIQPPLYHAPEVLLGVPWSYSADIWNLGVFVSISRHTGCTEQ